MARPLQIEIIAYAPTAFYHCLHCELVWQQAGVGPALHAEQWASALPEDLRKAYQDLAAWIATGGGSSCWRPKGPCPREQGSCESWNPLSARRIKQ